MSFVNEITKEANSREQDILIAEMRDKISSLENEVLNLKQQLKPVVAAEPSITNLLFNSDCNDSNNSRFEAIFGTGNTSEEIAYFFTHDYLASSLTVKNSLTNPADTVTSCIKALAHANIGSNIANPYWDKTNGQIIFSKTNTIDIPLGDFIDDGQTFVAGHPLAPGKSMYVTFLLARKSIYVRPKGRIYIGLWNNKSGSEGWFTGSNYGLSGKRQGKETPATTVSAQYMIAIETDQGYTLVSDVATIADSPALANFTQNCYNYLEWLYIAGTRKVRIFRKLGTGNVFEIQETVQINSYQDKGAIPATDTGLTSFPTFVGQKTSIESYWASTETLLQNIKIDGVDLEYDLFRVTLGISNSVNFSNVENPFLRIGLTDPAGVRVSDVITDSTTTITSAVAQFTTLMNGKDFTLVNPATGASHTGTVTYVSATELTLSSACPWTADNNILTVEDCLEDAFIIDKFGLDFNRGAWSPRSEDSASRVQVVASNPNGSNQGSGSIGTGGNGNDPIYGGGFAARDREYYLGLTD